MKSLFIELSWSSIASHLPLFTFILQIFDDEFEDVGLYMTSLILLQILVKTAETAVLQSLESVVLLPDYILHRSWQVELLVSVIFLEQTK